MEDNTFKLLGELILGPPSFDFIKNLETLKISVINQWDNDEIASEHYSLFGLTVFPFSHYYLSESRNFGGDFDDELISLYFEYNFDFNKLSYGMGATHLGTLLLFVDHLNNLKKFHELRKFLSNELLSWFKVFANSVEESDSFIFKPVISLTHDKLIDLWISLNGPENLEEINFYQHKFKIDDFMQDEKTSIQDISNFLITPSLCGVFISKPMISKIAQTLNIPIGFGDRSLLINDLFREAINYEVMDQLISILESYLDFQKQKFISVNISSISNYWIDKIEMAKELLSILKTESKNLQLDHPNF